MAVATYLPTSFCVTHPHLDMRIDLQLQISKNLIRYACWHNKKKVSLVLVKMDRTDLLDLTARQYPIDGNAIHTLGQFLALIGPAFAIQALGFVSILTGILLVTIVNTTFSNDTTLDKNLGFGFVTGGVFSSLSSQYEASVAAAQRLAALNAAASGGSGGSVTTTTTTTTTAAPTMFKVTCNLSASGGADITTATEGKCIVTT